MSVGLRDQRVRVYGYSQTTPEGFVSETFPYQGEYWARVTSPSAREATIAGQAEHIADAVVYFAEDVNIPRDGLLSLGPTFYRITGVIPARMAREIGVFAKFAESAEFNITGAP